MNTHADPSLNARRISQHTLVVVRTHLTYTGQPRSSIGFLLVSGVEDVGFHRVELTLDASDDEVTLRHSHRSFERFDPDGMNHAVGTNGVAHSSVSDERKYRHAVGTIEPQRLDDDRTLPVLPRRAHRTYGNQPRS